MARRELTAAIVTEARHQLAEVGPAALSLRAVARELGMASSAVYRYFATRDALITALLVVGYDELGAVAERADTSGVERSDHLGRWLAVTTSVRAWARAHPHDYALLYGSPVPGYAAPGDTVEPATRVIRVLIGIVADAYRSRTQLPASGPVELSPAAEHAVEPARTFAGSTFDADLTYRALVAWGGVIGALTLELFGHLHNAIDDYDAWFAESMRRVAPLPGGRPARDTLRS